ncbi:MAG: hypothetical protein ABUT39_19320 [Acidobacteriota bacterium]
MPGPPVSYGCAVTVTPGAAGPPDSGVIVFIPQTFVTAGGQPLAVTGSICAMVNSLSGIPYPLVIGPSQGLKVGGAGLVRMGDTIPSPPGMLLVIGPPAATFVNDLTA